MKHFAKYLLALGVAAFGFAACEQKEQVEEPVKYEVTASQFQNLKAVVTVTADKAVPADVTVALELKESTFPEGSLSFAETVLVKQGAKEAKAEVSLNADLLEYETDYKAVFSASVDKVKIGKDITLTYTTGEYPTLTVAQIVALMPAENKAKADFKGKLNVVVSYVNGSNCYIEDATGAILLYKKDDKLAVGKKLSGLFEGKVQNFNALPEISDLDLTAITSEDGGQYAAPQEITIAALNEKFTQLINHRVKLTGVTASSEIQNKINSGYEITQGDDKLILYVQNNLSTAIEAGSTFDVEGFVTPYNDAKQIKIFEDNAISNVVAPVHETVVEKLWDMISTADAAWTSNLSADGFTFAAGADFSIAIDDKNVYVPEFGGSKRLWAIDIASKVVKLVNTSTVESVGFDGSIYLTCARVVAKKDGTPVLIASNLFQDASSDNPTGRLYMWENGVDNAPRVAKMQQWGAGRRLGDTFTTYGNYEDCWLIMGTQTGNGFVTFKVPTGDTSALISRLAVETTNFASYYPFPGEITKGMFSWRGGDHDDGTLYRNRLMTIASTEDAIKSEGAHTGTLTKLDQWMANNENNNGIGFNYIEFNGKRYVIWCMNSTDAKVFDLIVKEGDVNTSWDKIINTTGTVLRDSFTGGMKTTWKVGADVAVWQTNNEVYIAVNKTQVGLAVYKMYVK